MLNVFGRNLQLLSEKNLQLLCAPKVVKIVILQLPLGWFLFFYIYTTRFWWLNLIYILWFIYDRQSPERGGYSNDWLKFSTIMKNSVNYFPAKLIVPNNVVLDNKQNYLFCYFPHGILPQGAYYNLTNYESPFRKKFSNFRIRQAVLHLFFIGPFLREIMLQMGFVSCSAKSLNHLLSKPGGGNIVALSPGGASEAYFSRKGEYRFFLNKRKGFVKVALRNGVPLVPVLTFGETDTFQLIESDIFKGFQEFCRNAVGFVPLVFHGRGLKKNWFGFIPFKTPLTTVLGKPIPVSKVENPTAEQVDELHERFIKELISLFDTYKYKFLKDPSKQFAKIV